MENCLTKNPDINVVYTINEPAAVGAYNALKAAGKHRRRLIVSVDGGCAGVEAGQGRRHRRHRAAVPAEDGRRSASRRSPRSPAAARSRRHSEGLDFFNTGVALVTDKPADGVDSIDTTEAASKICWG